MHKAFPIFQDGLERSQILLSVDIKTHLSWVQRDDCSLKPLFEVICYVALVKQSSTEQLPVDVPSPATSQSVSYKAMALDCSAVGPSNKDKLMVGSFTMTVGQES